MGALRSQKKDMAFLLIRHGANVNVRDYYGRPPIFHAIMYDDKEIIDALLNKGCYTTFAGRDGGTILHTAAAFATSPTLTRLTAQLQILPVSHLPTSTAVDEQGRTALKCAIQHIDTTDEPPYTIAEFKTLLTAIESRQMPHAVDIVRFAQSWPPVVLSSMIVVGSHLVNPIPSIAWKLLLWIRSTPILVRMFSGALGWLIILTHLALLLSQIGSSYFYKRMSGAGRNVIREATRQIFAQSSTTGKVSVAWYCVSKSSISRIDENELTPVVMWRIPRR